MGDDGLKVWRPHQPKNVRKSANFSIICVYVPFLLDFREALERNGIRQNQTIAKNA